MASKLWMGGVVGALGLAYLLNTKVSKPKKEKKDKKDKKVSDRFQKEKVTDGNFMSEVDLLEFMSKAIERYAGLLKAFRIEAIDLKSGKLNETEFRNRLPKAIEPADEVMINYIRATDFVSDDVVAPKASQIAVSFRTKCTMLLFVTLYHSCYFWKDFDINSTDTVGAFRDDLTKIWKLLSFHVETIGDLHEEEQYVFVIFACWIAQRLQDTAIFVNLLDVCVPLTFTGKLNPLTIPQLMCAASMTGRWVELSKLAPLLQSFSSEIYSERLSDYHKFCHDKPRLYIDLKQIIDLSGRYSFIGMDPALVGSCKFWQNMYIRSYKSRANENSEWVVQSFPPSDARHSLSRTGGLARMAYLIPPVPVILLGPMTDDSMELEGYEYLSKSVPTPEPVVPDLSKKASSIPLSTEHDIKPEKSEVIFMRANLRLNRKKFDGEFGFSKNVWVGHYKLTTEKVEELNETNELTDELTDLFSNEASSNNFADDQNECTLEEISENDALVDIPKPDVPRMKQSEPVEENNEVVPGAASTSEQDDVDAMMNSLLIMIKKRIEDQVEKKKSAIISEHVEEIEIEFTPLTSILEFTRQYFSHFGDDLIRFIDLIKGLDQFALN